MVSTHGRQFLCHWDVSPYQGFHLNHTLKNLYRDEHLHFIIPPNLPSAVLLLTQSILAPANPPPAAATPSPIKWTSASLSGDPDKPILSLHLPPSSGVPKHIAWHRRGDYLTTVGKLSSTSFAHLGLFFTSQHKAKVKAAYGYTRFRADIPRRLSRKFEAPFRSFCFTQRSPISLLQ